MADIKRRILRIDQQLPTFVVEASSITIGNNKSMLSILNAAANLVVSIREIYITNSQTSAVTGVVSSLELFRITGHSAGTSLTAQSFDTSDSLDANITIRTGATVSGESSSRLRRWQWSSDDWGTGTLDVESNDHVQQSIHPVFKANGEIKPIILRQNEGLTIKHTVNSTSGTFDLVILFTVE